MATYLGFSRRDVGAGRAAGGVAFLALILLHLWNVVQGARLRGSPVLVLAMVVTPVVALLVTAAVWHLTMPDEPNPRYGALAGGAAAAVSMVVFAAFVGVLATITEADAGTLGSVQEFASFVGFFVVYGALVILPVAVPIGAAMGYGYERYVASAQA